MRNLLFAILILLCILLTACSDATSIGIIGGADGPTSIIVAEKYENPIEHTCDMRLGQEFISVGGEKPENMCDSAWESMEYFVKELSNGGGNFYDGWMKNKKSAMISCNDGFRPVSFYIEVIIGDCKSTAKTV